MSTEEEMPDQGGGPFSQPTTYQQRLSKVPREEILQTGFPTSWTRIESSHPF
jgi:hypothetical protein